MNLAQVPLFISAVPTPPFITKHHDSAIHQFRGERAAGGTQFAHPNQTIDAIVRHHVGEIAPGNN